jgi:hypothetical protein
MTERSARSLRVFVNATGVDVPPGATVLDAVRIFDVAAADAVLSGDRIVTDSRGLPVPATDEVHAGSIFRLLPKRRAAGVQSDADADESE